MRRRWLVPAAALLLAACSVGPDYVRPDTAVPEAFKEPPPEAFKQAGVWRPATPADQARPAKWWEAFGDPTLDGLEEQLTAANQDLKVADANYRQARALVGFARSAEFPTLSVAPQADSIRDSAFTPYLGHTKTLGEFVLPIDATYEIDLWGRIHRSVTAAGEQAQASAADLATVALSLHAELAIDYFDLRSADAQQQLLDDTVKAYADALQLTRDRAEGGAAPDSDVAQAQTQLDSTRVQETDIAVQRAQFEHAIAVLIGKPPAQFGLPHKPLDLRPPAIPVGVPSELLQRRPDIAAAERRLAAANEQIGIAKAAYYPSLILGGTAGFEGTNISNWFNWPSQFWAIGATAGEILFDGGRRDATTRAALAGYDANVASYRQTTLSAFQQVEDNLAALRILEQESEQQSAAVASAKNALDIFTNRYLGGRDPYLQVITAQTVTLSNQRNEVDILRRREVASVLLVKALGGGWNAAELPRLAELRKTPIFP